MEKSMEQMQKEFEESELKLTNKMKKRGLRGGAMTRRKKLLDKALTYETVTINIDHQEDLLNG